MSEERRYTFSEVLERLMLTDEEVLLCKQHRDYDRKLDDMLEGIGNCDNRGGRVFGIKKESKEFPTREDIIGQNGNDGWKSYKWGKYKTQDFSSHYERVFGVKKEEDLEERTDIIGQNDDNEKKVNLEEYLLRLRQWDD
jgi:hypothetical protein